MSDFRKADNSVNQVFLEMIEKIFPELSGYSFGLLFRQKIKKSRGQMIFAEICLPSKLMSYFAKNDRGNPYDFLIIVDEMVWACGNEMDRVRLIRHELRHVHIDEKGKARMVGHDFADFHVEVALNVDAPEWCSKLAEIVQAGYDQLKGGGQDPRVNRKDIPGDTETMEEKPRQTHLGGGKPDLKNDYFTEEDQGIKPKVVKSKTKTEGKTKDLGKMPDKPVENATSKLDALAKKRGLLAPATQI